MTTTPIPCRLGPDDWRGDPACALHRHSGTARYSDGRLHCGATGQAMAEAAPTAGSES